MNQESNFRINRAGRSGSIEYESGNKRLSIYWEMSGVPEFDILIAPLNLKEWDVPRGEIIPLKSQLQILHALRTWSKEQKLKTDIDFPSELDTEDRVCGWANCDRKRLRGLAFCNKHYDESLLRR